MQVNSFGINTKKLQEVTGTEDNQPETTTNDFEIQLKGMLSPDQANNVSEEELFSALISERISNENGPELSDKFNSIFAIKKSEMQKSDSYIPMEDAAKEALRELRANGDLTSEQADKIYSQAFAGAQLDGNTNALYDGRGGPGDDSIAVSQLEQALLSARTITEKFDTAESSVEMRSLDESSNSKTLLSPILPVYNNDENDYTEPDQQDASGSSSKDDSDDTGINSIPELELALNFSKKIFNKDLDQSLMKVLGKKKENEL